MLFSYGLREGFILIYSSVQLQLGNHTDQSFESLRYKLEGRGFQFPIVSLEFFIDILLPATPWPCGQIGF